MGKVPSELQKYFWDTEISRIDLEKHKRYVIERLLDHGDETAIDWLNKNYPQREIIETLKISRSLSKRSANFWAIIYNISKEQIKSLNKQNPIWPY